MKKDTKNEMEKIMDEKGYEFWKEFCAVIILMIAIPAVVFVVVVAAIKLPVVIFGALKMIGESV